MGERRWQKTPWLMTFFGWPPYRRKLPYRIAVFADCVYPSVWEYSHVND